MKSVLCAMYVRGLHVACLRIEPDGLSPEELTSVLVEAALPAKRSAAEELAENRLPCEFDASLMMARFPGPAPDGWVAIPRGYARPRPAPPEPLVPLTKASFSAMRGLYGLYAGRFSGMLARENPEEWKDRLARLRSPLGLIEGERLLFWLDSKDGVLTELSAAPDAISRIPGALAAAGITRAPAPILGLPAEEIDDTLKLRLIRPFHLPGERIETACQLARATDGAVQWD
jgi:hypothetical protein